MKKADVLITGASGFIGSAVAHKLVASGYSVRALVRPSSPRRHIAGLDLEFCEGDLRDEISIKRAMQDVEYVFHIAADYRLWRGTRMKSLRPMSAGLARSCRRRCVPR